MALVRCLLDALLRFQHLLFLRDGAVYETLAHREVEGATQEGADERREQYGPEKSGCR